MLSAAAEIDLAKIAEPERDKAVNVFCLSENNEAVEDAPGLPVLAQQDELQENCRV